MKQIIKPAVNHVGWSANPSIAMHMCMAMPGFAPQPSRLCLA